MSLSPRAVLGAAAAAATTLGLAVAPAQASRPVNGYPTQQACLDANNIPNINSDLYCGYVRKDGRFHVWAAPYPNNY